MSRKTLTGAAFALALAGTTTLLVALAALGPFGEQAAPSIAWSIVLWGMVGLIVFLLTMRVALMALTALLGVGWAAKRGAVAALHLMARFLH